MKAELMLDERHVLAEDAFAEIVVWRLPQRSRGSEHSFKYRLALVEHGVCALRYDNEAGKGDHRHTGDAEQPYVFRSPKRCSLTSGPTSMQGGDNMKTVTLDVASRDAVTRRTLAAFKGRKKQGARISFARPELLFRLLTAKRWELIRAMTGPGR